MNQNYIYINAILEKKTLSSKYYLPQKPPVQSQHNTQSHKKMEDKILPPRRGVVWTPPHINPQGNKKK